MAATVLLVEDERKLRELVRSYLERAGLSVLSTGSGAEAITLAAATSPDLVILDLGLPDIHGEGVARELRAAGKVPILILTAKAAEEDRIAGLELGADDYVTKPFSPRELVLRVQAILRRGSPAVRQGTASYGGGTLVIDEPRRQITVRGAEADLTPTEWGILAAIATVPGRVYTRSELINMVRGYEFEGYERTIDSHVKNLRRKIEEDASSPRIVLTVLGTGYRLGLIRDDLWHHFTASSRRRARRPALAGFPCSRAGSGCPARRADRGARRCRRLGPGRTPACGTDQRDRGSRRSGVGPIKQLGDGESVLSAGPG